MEITAKSEQEWQSSFDDVGIFDGRGKANVYQCEDCGYLTFTVDRAKGVTPYLIRCKRNDGLPSQCKGTASSKLYRVPVGVFTPTHEWYRPTLEEVQAMDEAMKEHCSNGGLLLRKIEGFAEYIEKSTRHQGKRERQRRLRHG